MAVAAAAGARTEDVFNAGLQQLMQLSDSALSERVIQALPPETYNCVQVQSVEYNFGGLSTQPTRVIDMRVSTAASVAAFVHACFTGFGLIKYPGYDQTVDPDKLKNQLIAHICNVGAKDKEEIELAYAQCTNVALYIANDGKAIEIQLRRNKAVKGAYEVTLVVRQLIPLIVLMFSKTSDK
jgi:hypothetical protein